MTQLALKAKALEDSSDGRVEYQCKKGSIRIPPFDHKDGLAGKFHSQQSKAPCSQSLTATPFHRIYKIVIRKIKGKRRSSPLSLEALVEHIVSCPEPPQNAILGVSRQGCGEELFGVPGVAATHAGVDDRQVG